MAIQTIKFSEFVSGGDVTQGDVTVGLGGGSNARFDNPWTFLPSGATGDRPAIDPLMYYRLRFNTTLIVYEYYDPVTTDWVQLADTENLPVPGAPGTFVQSDGADWITSTVTIPLTLAANRVLYSDAANSISTISPVNGGVLTTDNAGVPSFLANPGADYRILHSLNGTTPAYSPYAIPATAGTANKFVATNGTNWVYSTSSFPLIAGAINTVLQSDGTNWNASVPAYPASAGSVGQIFRSDGTNFALTTATYPATTTINQILYSSSSNIIAGISAANSAALVSSSIGVPQWTASMTNGQLLIGSTGSTPTPNTLTAGTGITISNTAGNITISGTGSGYTWTEVTGTSQSMSADNGYIANNAALVTLTLPATSAVGTSVIVQGKGAGGWRIAQNSGQTIRFGSVSTTTGVTGNLSSTNRYDSIELVCITANTEWAVLTAPQGIIDYA